MNSDYLDFGPPVNFLARIQAPAFKILEQATENFSGRVPSMLKEAGLDSLSEAECVTNIFEPVRFYEAHKR